jgi:hypothetical protein
VRLKSIALPPEHGAWGFLLEPIVLGLAIAPTWAGLGLALGVIGLFLVRHPLKLAFADWQRRKRYARTVIAERVLLVYGALAAIGMLLAIALGGVELLLPLVLAAPLVLLMIAGTLQNRGRDLLPELAGAAALAATASSMALAGGESAGTALALWVILNARSLPSILYVRARLRLEKDKPFSLPTVTLSHLAGVAAVLALILAGLAPVLPLLAMAILLVRALVGLSPYRRRVQTRTIGFLEIGYGLMVVVLTAVGYAGF